MGGLTWPDRPTGVTTPPRQPRMARNTSLHRAARLTGMHSLVWLTKAICMERQAGMAIPELLYTLTVKAGHSRPTTLVGLTRRNRHIRC